MSDSNVRTGASEEDPHRAEALERLRWLDARLREASSRLGLMAGGRPYRDTARRQTLRTIGRHRRAVFDRVTGLERTLSQGAPRPSRAAERARLLAAVGSLVGAARSSLELAGVRRRWSADVARDEVEIRRSLRRSPELHGLYVERLGRALGELHGAMDEAFATACPQQEGLSPPRDADWGSAARDALDRAEGWLQRLEEPGSASSRGRGAPRVQLAVTALEAQTDYVEVLTRVAEIFCGS